MGLSGLGSVVDTYYCCEHNHDHIDLSAIEGTDFGKYIEKLTREMWERKALEKGYDPVLIEEYAKKLTQGIKTGYKKETPDIDFTTPDKRKLHHLNSNTWQFSAAKTYSQLREMSEALRRPDGTERPFDEFRIQSTLITGKYLRHLKTEFNLAKGGAQMAAMWERIQAEKHIYPYLQFIAVEDEHTTALCLSLNGVIKHVDDPFWVIWYPLNHYGCRSTVKQLRTATETPDSEIIYPIIPDIFKVNLGQRGLAFPEDHAYFTAMPPEVMREARQFFPYNMQFDILDVSDDLKGIVRQHFMTDEKASDYKRVLDFAIKRASEGENIMDIMPTLDPDTFPAQRQVIFPDAKKGKSADLRENKVLWEEEGIRTFSRRAVKGAVEAGADQANHVVVNIPSEMQIDFELWKIARDKFKDYPDLVTIIFQHGDQEFRFERKK